MPTTPLQPLTVADLGRAPLRIQVDSALMGARRDLALAAGLAPTDLVPQLAFSTKACIRALVAYGNAVALHRALGALAGEARRRGDEAMLAADGLTWIGLFATRRLALVQRQRHLAAQMEPLETYMTRTMQVLERFLPRVPLAEQGAVHDAIHESLDPNFTADVEAAQHFLGELYHEDGVRDPAADDEDGDGDEEPQRLPCMACGKVWCHDGACAR